MTVVAVAALAVAALALVALAMVARSSAANGRQHARREDLLVNQLLHLSGRTWSPPPAAGNGHGREPVALSYTVHPESLEWEAVDA